MSRKRRATLTSRWWKDQYTAIRHCSFCGGKLSRRYVAIERKKRHVCASCRKITYINPKVVVGLIPVLPDGRVVLLQRDIEPALGKWSYPGGYQELGESSQVAAIRETREEICVDVKIKTCLGVYSYPDAGVVTIVYIGKVLKGQCPKAGEESQTVQAFSPRRIPWKDLAFRSSIDALKDWLALSARRQLAK